MKLIQILFSPPMVAAEREGIKDVTRRMRGLEELNNYYGPFNFHYHEKGTNTFNEMVSENNLKLSDDQYLFSFQGTLDPTVVKCPYGKPGDVLWVRETFYAYGHWFRENEQRRFEFRDITLDPVLGVGKYEYMDSKPKIVFTGRNAGAIGWHKRPSLFMPYSACRTWLEVVSVRPERLHDITDEDAVREGAMTLGLYPGYNMSPKQHFFGLWVNINGNDSLEKNPWVWRVEFKPTSKPNL